MPLDQLHGKERPQVGKRPHVVDRYDAGMLELAADLSFLHEPANQLRLLAMGFEQDLDGQVTAELAIAAAEDGPHAAAGNLAKELVASRAIPAPGISDEEGLTNGDGSSPRSVSRKRMRGMPPIDSARDAMTLLRPGSNETLI